jgi:hypothetical protein
MLSTWSARRGSERRSESRQAASHVAVDSPAVEVELVDASSSGLGIEVERPLKVGVIYPFLLRCGPQVSEVYGLVRWCETASPTRFRAGISVGKTVGPPLSHLTM